MHYLDTYKNYNDTPFNGLDIYYHKENNCIKFGDHYLFVNDGKVVKHDELLKEDWSDYLPDFKDFVPDTTSEWIHLGVDGVSAIADFIPGPGNAISFVIDILHTLAYFMEAYFDEENRVGLIFGGVITALFATIPEVGNLGGIIFKRLIKLVGKGTGKLFKNIFKVGFLPTTLIRKILPKMFDLSWISKWINSAVIKHGNSLWFKGLKKIPMVKKMLKFAEKDLPKFLKQGEKAIMNDFKMYQKAALKEVETVGLQSYKTLPIQIRKGIPEKDFIEILNKKAMKKIPTRETIEKGGKIVTDFTKVGQNQTKIIATEFKNMKTAANKHLVSTISNPVVRKLYKPIYNKKLNAEIVKSMKAGTKFAPEHIVENMIKFTPKSILKQLVKLPIKKGIPVSLKALINNYDKISGTSDTDTDTNVEDKTSNDDFGDDNGLAPATSKSVKDVATPFEKKWSLYETNIEKTEDMGKSTIVFETPDKQGEDGKIYIDGGVYKTIDFSNNMKLYTDEEELFDDLVKIGKKRADKRRKKVRKGELKKWEKTPMLSTPYIKEIDDYRYEFDFLIRERSAISLNKKEFTQEINWDDVLESTDFKEKGFYKVNGSLYITLERKTND